MIYVGLLRGINVGGNRMVAMGDLRALVEGLGFADVKTLLQSGNLVFRGPAQSTAKIEAMLETATATRLKMPVEYHVRTADEWAAIVERNPFPSEAKKTPAFLVLSCFKEPMPAANVKVLQAAIVGREKVKADGRQLYMTYPDGQGNSKAGPLLDKTLPARGTARNWNTVLKLAALCGQA